MAVHDGGVSGELMQLVQSMLGDDGGGLAANMVSDVRPVLNLGDLLGDPSGEIVLGVGEGVGAVLVEADSPVVGRGIAASHVTAGGDDVAGHGYVAFASGVTLYYPADLDVTLTGLSAGGV